MSLIYGYSDNNNPRPSEVTGNVKSFKTSITFTKYNTRKVVKVFDKGIILMGVVTVSGRASPVHSGQVYYKFYNPDGSTLVRKIYSYDGNYFEILNKEMDDKVINLRDIYTVPNACCITVELATYSRIGKPTGEQQDRKGKAVLAPPGPVKLNIALFYTEFPAFNYNGSGSVFAF